MYRVLQFTLQGLYNGHAPIGGRLSERQRTMKKAMTKDEFLRYAEEVTGPEAMESVYEQISEISGEIARFGDSGPGTLYRMRLMQQEHAKICRQYERLTGRKLPKFPPLPMPR